MQGDIKTLQMLRGCVALCVVYFHTGSAPSFGALGINVFFVLSGFVMGVVLARGASPVDFAISRLARILPLYWFLTTLVFVVAELFPHVLNSTSANFYNYLRSLIFIPYIKESGALQPMLAVGWTLNYEMFFYGSIFASMLFFRRYVVFSTSVVILSVSWVLGTSSDEICIRFFGNPALLEFLVGLYAHKVFSLYSGGVPSSFQVPLFVSVLIIFSGMCYAEAKGWKFNATLMYSIPAAILVVLLAFLDRTGDASKGLIAGFMLKIGSASYAIYLSHIFVLQFLRKIMAPSLGVGDPVSPFGAVFALVLAMLVGYGLYVVFDRPASAWCKKKLKTLLLNV